MRAARVVVVALVVIAGLAVFGFAALVGMVSH